MRKWLLLSAFLGGCASRLPVDQYVMVHTDGVRSRTVSIQRADGPHDESLADYVALGERYWDPVGGRLYTDAEIGNRLPVAEISVSCADSVEDNVEGQSPMWYSSLDGQIHVDCHSDRFAVVGYAPEAIASTCAHEFGHAFGLAHVPEGSGAVMEPKPLEPALTWIDVEQFHSVRGD